LNTLLSIIIPHLQGKKNLYECLESIQTNIPYEIIIVDNNSKDNSVKNIKEKFPDIQVIHSEVNKGYAGGCNLGAQHAKGKYLLFLNDDTIINENAIDILFQMIVKDKNISAVQPKILNYYNKDQFDYAGASGGYIDYLGYPFSRGRIFNTIEKDVQQYNDKKKIFWASGTAFITKAEIFKKIGQFDEMLFAHMEEIDLCWRVQNLGYDVKYHYKSEVYHLNGGTLNKENHKKTYLNFRNQLYMLTKNYKDNLFVLLFFKFFIDLIVSFYLLTKGIKHSLAIFTGYISFYKRLTHLIGLRKKLNRKIKHYSTYSIIFYFIGLKRLKKV